MSDDARIVLTLDYEPTLDCYPDHVKTKADAFRFDIQSVLDRHMSVDDLLEFADCIDYEVAEI